MSKYYVFRINYDDEFNLIRNELLNYHRLRQGWGAAGMQIDRGYEAFKSGWQAQWGDTSDDAVQSKYKDISIMLEIEPGDYIIVPKISVQANYVCKSFIIAKCKTKYSFSVLEKAKDFGHIIEVEDIFSCGYDKDLFSQVIKSKFKGYQRPLNHVWDEKFIEAVEALIHLHSIKPDEFEKDSIGYITMIGNATSDNRNLYLNTVKEALQDLDPKNFEYLIQELFEKNGYELTRRNWYDRQGGDADLVFECFNKDTLMYNILDICDDVPMPHIYVQAKNKRDNDLDDKVGVEQLLKIKDKIPEKNAILMVINLTNNFTEDAKRMALENGIILINGIMFASLLVRYGIEVDLNK